MIENISRICNELTKSPIFNLSLASKELFHSNFWYWFKNIGEIDVVKLFYPQLEIQEGDKIVLEREKANIDLTINITRKDRTKTKIVIENKVKDIPHIYQLKKYVEKVKADQYILVSLFEPPYSVPSPWIVVTYKELAQRIEMFLTNVTDSYHQAIIKDYIQVLYSLSDLVNIIPNGNSYDYFSDNKNMQDVLEILESIKMNDVYLKYRGSHTVNFVYNTFRSVNRDRLCYYGDPGSCKNGFLFNWALNNKQATLDFVLKNTDLKIDIGVQVQGNQYRRFISANVSKNTLTEIASEKLWFFSEEWRSPQGLNFLKYVDKPNNRTFYYQFRKFEEPQTYSDLEKRILQDLKCIIEKSELIYEKINIGN